MLITKECDYGIRTIRALSNGTKKTAQEICNAEHIPQKFAYKILKKLQIAGLVKNKRGPEGGYVLDKSLDAFTMYDIITAIDERLFLIECMREGTECPNNKNTPCAVHHEVGRYQQILINEMKSKTIKELLT